MALPVILVDSATGSDANNISGAGPSTPVQGTAASTDVAGTTVTVDAGTNISGVAIDGSAVITVNDTTAGHRRFAKITNSAGSGGATPTFTVAEAFTGSLAGKAWGVGGVRASVGGSMSALLLNNNGSSGDAMPGWAIQMASGHTETIAANLVMRRAGDATSGAISLRGISGAATLPIITFSNNGDGLTMNANYQMVRDFELRNTNATKTASIGIKINSQGTILGMKINHATNYFWKGMLLNALAGNTTVCSVVNCEVANCANVGIENANTAGSRILWSSIHDNGVGGILFSAAFSNCVIYANAIADNIGDGIRSTAAASASDYVFIVQNTIVNNTSDGIECTQVSTSGVFCGMVIANNIFEGNLGYGINFSDGSITAAGLYAAMTCIYGNNFYSNTVGKYLPTGMTSEFETTLDPTFTDAVNGDFSIGTNLKALGYPIGGTTKVGYSPTYSYVDPGVAQRQEPTTSGLLLYAVE